MKKFTYTAVLLSLLGAVFSIMLLLEHYNPDVNLGVFSCGTEIESPCVAVSSSPYSEFLGIPLAALGLFFYLVVFFTALIAEDAKGDLYRSAAALLLPITALSLLVDLFLFAKLVSMDAFCLLCVSTYGINALLTALCAVWFFRVRKESGLSLRTFFRDNLLIRGGDPFRRSTVSAYGLAMILLLAVTVLFSVRMSPDRAHELTAGEIRGFLHEFYRLPVDTTEFRRQGLVFGNPDAKVTIVVFSDFLCSACHEFYRIERRILSKYRNRVKIVNYIFPLDSECNGAVKRTIYPDSCTASRAVLAASHLRILNEYVAAHFTGYRKYKAGYSAAMAAETLARSGHGNLAGEFLAAMKSGEIEKELQENIGFCLENKIDATPTFFIAGRRLVGIPQQNPLQLIEAIIESELTKSESPLKGMK